jgi:spore maturation protein CgeB
VRIVMFYHSLLSDWNHGNAHFLRGVASELVARGHDLHIFEPADAWSLQRLLHDHGPEPVNEFRAVYPQLDSIRYDGSLDLEQALARADLVIVHEWNDHDLVRRIGEQRATHSNFILLFHDTHHRSVTSRESMAAYDLRHYDGVLAFGNVIRDIFLEQHWTRHAWTWHEAADARVFYPRTSTAKDGDLVWIGNWGDDERSAELHEFLLQPVKALGLKARVYGVRYPRHAILALKDAGIEYEGWLPNYKVPEVFAQFRVTVHVPRRPYVRALPGIPTIRPFEALACGIPLISAPWTDAEHLFTPGADYLVAENGLDMQRQVFAVLKNSSLAESLSLHGRNTILARHTCAHRVDQLLAICQELRETSATENRQRVFAA